MIGVVFKDRLSGRFSYRFRVPRKFVSEVGQTELKRALGTRDREVANRRALGLARLALMFIEDVRSGMLDRPEIAARLRAFYEAELDADLCARETFSSAPEWTVDDALPFNRQAEVERWIKIARAGAFHLVEEELQALSKGLPCALRDSERRQLAAHIIHTRLQAKRVGANRDQGNLAFVSDDPFITSLLSSTLPSSPSAKSGAPQENYRAEPSKVAATPNSTEPSAAPTNAVLAVRTIEERAIGVAESRGITDKKTQEKYRIAAEAFVDFIGDRPLHSISRSDVAEFYDALRDLRVSARTHYGAGTSFTECVRRSRQDKLADQDDGNASKFASISETTIRSGYLSPLSMIFDDLVNREVVEANPVAAFKSPKRLASKKGRKKRDAFTDIDVKQLIESPLYSGAKSADRLTAPGDFLDQGWRFWLSPLLAITGMRSSEAGQLRVDDVIEYEVDGARSLSCIRVWTDEDAATNEEESAPQKKIKTEAGYRFIPIHPQLEAMGFLRLVAARRAEGSTRIFPDWVPNKGQPFSDAASRYFNRTYYPKVGIKRKKTCIHSWRHFFKDKLRDAGIQARDQNAIMGHSDERTPNTYGSERIAVDSLDRFLKIDFGFSEIRRWDESKSLCTQRKNDMGSAARQADAERLREMRRRPSRINKAPSRKSRVGRVH